ncbi:MAG: phosphatase PAP2 family protein [Alphaproteobacteria bacterium]|nr:phosphatase PAP2 family protein [Alphaproteobacteria bacterium]
MKAASIYAAILAAILLLLLVPHIDLWVSSWFYVPQRGFVLRDWAPTAFIYHMALWIPWAIGLVVVAAAAWLFLMRRPLWRFDRKALLFIVVSTVLGPGLLANTILKDHWGRARPLQIEAFGGTHHFTPAPLPATECMRNCSFVSGHAALGFSLLAFAFLLPPGRTRHRGIAAVIIFGGFIGLVRIAQGGHFLSDVVWAGLLIFGTTVLLHWCIVERNALAAPTAIRFCRRCGDRAEPVLFWVRTSPGARIGSAVTSIAVLMVLSIIFIDRRIALYMHGESADMLALFRLIGELGEGWGWLVLFALAFAALHWGGELPRLREVAPRMRAWSAIPVFLFASIAITGLATDIIKIGFGRMRPKLLFGGNLYGFTGLAWRPDHWSFPSGHTATFVAMLSALWWLWPQHLLFYILAGAIVAASRVVVGDHYPSDVVAGAVVAVLATRGTLWLVARWGIDLAAAKQGMNHSEGIPPWPCRGFRQIAMRRRARADTGRVAADRLPWQRGV